MLIIFLMKCFLPFHYFYVNIFEFLLFYPELLSTGQQAQLIEGGTDCESGWPDGSQIILH